MLENVHGHALKAAAMKSFRILKERTAAVTLSWLGVFAEGVSAIGRANDLGTCSTVMAFHSQQRNKLLSATGFATLAIAQAPLAMGTTTSTGRTLRHSTPAGT